MRWVWLILGVLAVLTGIVWTLQGVGILGGSIMSGRAIFVAIGLIVSVIGLALIAIGVRQRGAPTA